MDISRTVDELMMTKACRVFRNEPDGNVNLIVSIAADEIPNSDDIISELTLGDIIIAYGECINSALDDGNYGDYRGDRSALPIEAFMIQLLKSEKDRYALQNFMKTDYNEITAFIMNCRDIPNYQRSLMKRIIEKLGTPNGETFSQVARQLRSQTQRYWRPSEDIGEYLNKIRASYSSLLLMIFYPLYFLAGMRSEYATHVSEPLLDLNELLSLQGKLQIQSQFHTKTQSQ